MNVSAVFSSVSSNLLGFTDSFADLSLAFYFLENLVAATRALLKAKVEHADSFFQIEGTRDTDDVNTVW